MGGSIANADIQTLYHGVSRSVRLQPDLRHARDVDLADVVDLVALHRQPLESVADTDGGVARWVAAKMAHDAIGEHTPRQQFREPAVVFFDLELPGLAAH